MPVLGILTWLKIGAAVVAFGLLAWGVAHIYNKGKESVRNEITRQNNEATGRANDANMSWRDCVDSGRVYDFATSHCSGSAAGDR